MTVETPGAAPTVDMSIEDIRRTIEETRKRHEGFPQPEPGSFQEGLVGELLAAFSLMEDKQHDYGPGNIMDSPLVDIISAWGVPGIDRSMTIQLGVFVRLFDKISRLKRGFMNVGQLAVEGESLEDTWRDVLGYAVIALMVRHGTFTQPLTKKTDEPDVPSIWENVTEPCSDEVRYEPTDDEIREAYRASVYTSDLMDGHPSPDTRQSEQEGRVGQASHVGG